MPMSESDRESLSFKLGQIFKPAMPINRQDLFAGRRPQIHEVVDAINQNGQHVVLYGERGVGKTSLANMLFPALQTPAKYLMTPQTNCVGQDTFTAIWKRIFEEILVAADTQEMVLPKNARSLLEHYISQYVIDIAPDAIRKILLEIGSETIVVVVIDEFDTIRSPQVRQTIADTIKYLSDRNVPATVVLIGVSEDIEGLIEDHQSIERCLAQVHMPRMSVMELQLIITTCLGMANMTINKEALSDLSRLSKGLPHYAHLLGLASGRAAISDGQIEVLQEHVTCGIRNAIGKVQASILASYRRAITSSRTDALYREVLLACALARTDEFGYFAPVDVRSPLALIRNRECKIESFAHHLHAFSSEARGPVLKRETLGKSRPRFRFFNPLTQPYVLLKGVSDGLITESDLKALSPESHDSQDTLFDLH